ncbi:MAG: archease [Planctomycetota bacterium]
MYQFFDHTGDFGVDVRSETLAGAVAEVARAFLDLLTGDPGRVEAREARELEVEGADLLEGLVAFGNELLFLFEVEGFLVARFEVEAADEEGIAGTAWGEPFDPARHPIARPIKAVTHHAAACEQGPEGVSLRLVFDL